MAERDKDVTDLEDLFQAARRQGIALPDGLEDRIIADGLQVQRARQGRSASPRRASAGRVRQFLDLLGGWPAMGGLAMACATGIWLGFAPPQALPDPFGFVQSGDTGLFADDDLVLAMVEE
ncbi:hypothetical protein [Sedimentitalea nanhaiensis]|uniref:Uncharacterized protein n=1 Tax=Sedimentitalea nanhaiensis TaxID=999627 RepID=A0A1I7ARQ1_9RHOB|nr:hypothetical protein [Sedimentitalea nanhaiensis]SFT77577.1 hypothetical protein SAMN05216236_107142 [Sedimentitalea nanhaiensis]